MIGLYKTGIGIILALLPLAASPATGSAFRAGISISAGTHCGRVGVFAMAHCWSGRIQSGARIDCYTVARAWGHHKKGWEMQISGNVGAGYGAGSARRPMHLDISSSMLPYTNYCGYSHLVYIDSYGCSQRTGAATAQWGKVKVSSENDFMGETHSDRFRTAGVLLAYIDDTVEAGVKLVLWTGDAFGRAAVTVKESEYPARFGYKDISRTKHGRYSVGALGLQLRSDKYYGQSLSVYAGADAEQFRNIFQNKLMHDLWFVPESWISYKMMNYPMLTEDGLPYLFAPETGAVRRPRLLIQSGLNEPTFY